MNSILQNLLQACIYLFRDLKFMRKKHIDITRITNWIMKILQTIIQLYGLTASNLHQQMGEQSSSIGFILSNYIQAMGDIQAELIICSQSIPEFIMIIIFYYLLKQRFQQTYQQRMLKTLKRTDLSNPYSFPCPSSTQLAACNHKNLVPTPKKRKSHSNPFQQFKAKSLMRKYHRESTKTKLQVSPIKTSLHFKSQVHRHDPQKYHSCLLGCNSQRHCSQFLQTQNRLVSYEYGILENTSFVNNHRSSYLQPLKSNDQCLGSTMPEQKNPAERESNSSHHNISSQNRQSHHSLHKTESSNMDTDLLFLNEVSSIDKKESITNQNKINSLYEYFPLQKNNHKNFTGEQYLSSIQGSSQAENSITDNRDRKKRERIFDSDFYQ